MQMIKLSMHKASQADGGVWAVLFQVDVARCKRWGAISIFIAGRRFYSRRKVAGGRTSEGGGCILWHRHVPGASHWQKKGLIVGKSHQTTTTWDLPYSEWCRTRQCTAAENALFKDEWPVFPRKVTDQTI